MDPAVAWYQPEQEGPAKRLWLRIWETQSEIDKMNLKNLENANPNVNKVQDFIPINDVNGESRNNNYFNPARRKVNDNRASTFNLNKNHDALIGEYGGCPWRIPNYNYKPGVLGLHEEIEHFYMYMSPTETEHMVRSTVVNRIRAAILTLWPQARVEVFGSFRTGLYLPTSDIDLVVIGQWEKLPLWTLERELVVQDIAEKESIKVLEKATVPIVKMTDKYSDVKVDISFNMSSGVKSAELIKHFKDKYPVLSRLVMVLKQFLLQRDLNEVFTGGISSYSLILMCISFLQLHPRPERLRQHHNLGVLLIEFFELYGRKFNYVKTAIRVKNGGSYVSKDEIQKEMNDGHRPSLLCIEDRSRLGTTSAAPVTALCKSNRRFDYGYIVLHAGLAGLAGLVGGAVECGGGGACHSVLGRVVRVTDHVLQYRRWVRDTFEPYFFPLRARPPRPPCVPLSSREPSPDPDPDPDPDVSDTDPEWSDSGSGEGGRGSRGGGGGVSGGGRGTSPPPLSALQCSSPTPRRVSAHQSLIIHHITSNSDFNNIPSGVIQRYGGGGGGGGGVVVAAAVWGEAGAAVVALAGGPLTVARGEISVRFRLSNGGTTLVAAGPGLQPPRRPPPVQGRAGTASDDSSRNTRNDDTRGGVDGDAARTPPPPPHLHRFTHRPRPRPPYRSLAWVQPRLPRPSRHRSRSQRRQRSATSNC